MAEFIEGKRAVIEALRAEVPLSRILLADNVKRDPMVNDILRKARQRDVKVQTVPRAELDKLSARNHPLDLYLVGFTNALLFTAMLSVSLGIMNLLPIPPLDGGRFVVEIYQRIRRKAVSIKAMNYLSLAGMALFGLFFIVMMNQDIQRFIFGNWS